MGIDSTRNLQRGVRGIFFAFAPNCVNLRCPNTQILKTQRKYLQDDATLLLYLSRMNKQIKIVKRNEPAPKVQAAHKPRPVEQSATVIVKSWIAELKERKRNERHSFSLVFGAAPTN